MNTDFSAVSWVAAGVLLAVIVAVDLAVIGRRTGPVTLRSAARWVALYVGLAITFGLVLAWAGPTGSGTEFFAGYLTEYSLSVDNLFVFLIIMSRFAVPAMAQDKVLYVGILLSMLLRAVLIVAGAAVIAAATWTFVIFGAVLLYTAVRLLASEEEPEFTEGLAVRAIRRILPVTPDYHGRSLTVRSGGRRLATPLFLAVAAIGVANVVFAMDSIPAIFGLTDDPFIVLTANAFALMGLRQLYFMIAALVQRIHHLDYGLAAILGFIGIKLVLEGLHPLHHLGPVDLPTIGTSTSLLTIVAILAVVAAANGVRVLYGRVRADASGQAATPAHEQPSDDPRASEAAVRESAELP